MLFTELEQCEIRRVTFDFVVLFVEGNKIVVGDLGRKWRFSMSMTYYNIA